MGQSNLAQFETQPVSGPLLLPLGSSREPLFLNHVVVAVSSAVRWILLLNDSKTWMFLVSQSVQFNESFTLFRYTAGIIFSSVFSPRLFSSVGLCQWHYDSVKSSFLSSLCPLIFSLEQVCASHRNHWFYVWDFCVDGRRNDSQTYP